MIPLNVNPAAASAVKMTFLYEERLKHFALGSRLWKNICQTLQKLSGGSIDAKCIGSYNPLTFISDALTVKTDSDHQNDQFARAAIKCYYK